MNKAIAAVLLVISGLTFAYDGRTLEPSQVSPAQLAEVVAESAFYYNLDGRGFPGTSEVTRVDHTQIEVVGDGVVLPKMDPDAYPQSEDDITFAKRLKFEEKAVCQANIGIRRNSSVQNLASVLVAQCTHLSDGSPAPEYEFEMTSWEALVDVTPIFSR